jgi:hypothetical protein
LWSGSAAGADCPYLSANEYLTAVQTNAGVDVTYWSDGYFMGAAEPEHCTISSVEGGQWATCEGGWSGPYIVAGSSLEAHDDGIMVILNDVLYRTCGR